MDSRVSYKHGTMFYLLCLLKLKVTQTVKPMKSFFNEAHC